MSAYAELLEDPSEEKSRRTLLEEARELLLDAVSSARSYGKDRILLVLPQGAMSGSCPP